MRRFLAGIVCCLVVCLQAAAKDKVLERVIHYPSVDQRGDSVMLSGKLSVPQDRQPKGIILIPHYTIAADSEAPSNSSKGEVKHFRKDYIVLMPDYIGYGLTRERIHPYLDGELTARNTVDLLLYAGPILDSIFNSQSPVVQSPVVQSSIVQSSIYIVGFSQGGAAALWTLRLIEEQYADLIHVKRCFAGSGPYDVAATYDDAVQRNHTTLPLVIPMMIYGTDEAYDLHLRTPEFFTQPMQRDYQRLIRDKQIGITRLFFSMPHHKVSYWFTPQGMDKSHPETKRMYEGLLRSSLVHFPLDDSPVGADSICPSWRPRTPVYVFHSTKDDIVTFHCALHLRRCFSDLPDVTYDFGDFGSHLRSSGIFFKRVRKLLAEEE